MIAVPSMPIFLSWVLQNNYLLHNFAHIGLSGLFAYICIVLFICKYKTISPTHKTLGSFFLFFSTQPSGFWGCQTLQWSLQNRKAHELSPGTNLKHFPTSSAKPKNHLKPSPHKQTVARKSHHLTFFSVLSFFWCLFECTSLRIELYSKMLLFKRESKNKFSEQVVW